MWLKTFQEDPKSFIFYILFFFFLILEFFFSLSQIKVVYYSLAPSCDKAGLEFAELIEG